MCDPLVPRQDDQRSRRIPALGGILGSQRTSHSPSGASSHVLASVCVHDPLRNKTDAFPGSRSPARTLQMVCKCADTNTGQLPSTSVRTGGPETLVEYAFVVSDLLASKPRRYFPSRGSRVRVPFPAPVNSDFPTVSSRRFTAASPSLPPRSAALCVRVRQEMEGTPGPSTSRGARTRRGGACE